MSTQDWDVIVSALRILSPALASYAIYILRQILTELKSLNQRVKSVEDWNQAHDRQDDLRFTHAQQQIDRLQREVERLEEE